MAENLIEQGKVTRQALCVLICDFLALQHDSTAATIASYVGRSAGHTRMMLRTDLAGKVDEVWYGKKTVYRLKNNPA